MSTNIYILELENNKFYVGRSINPQKRILNHFSNNGSKWTKKYKPVSILKVFKGEEPIDEEKYTLLTMKKYGISNVRGGAFCTILLCDADIYVINKILLSIDDKCYKCGSFGHFSSECTVDKDIAKLLKNEDKLEICIRKILGQTKPPFLYKEYYNNPHLRQEHIHFSFDARSDWEDNKNILDMFSQFYGDKRPVMWSYKGYINVGLFSTDKYNKYNMWKVYNELGNYIKPNNTHKDIHVDYTYYNGCGTVNIIMQIIYDTYSQYYKENKFDFVGTIEDLLYEFNKVPPRWYE